MICPWCGQLMETDSDGNLTCPHACQDDCPTCDLTIGDCGPDCPEAVMSPRVRH